MGCSYPEYCRIFKVYVGIPNSTYHGELCLGCLSWVDNPGDSDFRRRVDMETGWYPADRRGY